MVCVTAADKIIVSHIFKPTTKLPIIDLGLAFRGVGLMLSDPADKQRKVPGALASF
jgi:hypothetical protein